MMPRWVASYSSELDLFMDLCPLEGGIFPLDADTPFIIVRHISWAADRGRNKAGGFQPYLYPVNIFFRDHLREPAALGPLVI
eukprot:jgi/Tetstr1/438966/TSEL_027459.t1